MTNQYPILGESSQRGKDWVHNSCGTVLLAAEVRHSIHNSPIPLSGFGEVAVERVPYCPKCQAKPSEIGNPLKENPVDVSERQILRRMRNDVLS